MSNALNSLEKLKHADKTQNFGNEGVSSMTSRLAENVATQGLTITPTRDRLNFGQGNLLA
jgi:hypothetical protein